jgi:hypothetical protein
VTTLKKWIAWLNPPSPPSPRRRLHGVVATRPVRRIAAVLLTDATNLGVFTISSLARVNSRRVYTTLARFEKMGWIGRHQENRAPEPEGYPRRMFYTLTPEGRDAAAYLAGLELPAHRHWPPALDRN